MNMMEFFAESKVPEDKVALLQAIDSEGYEAFMRARIKVFGKFNKVQATILSGVSADPDNQALKRGARQQLKAMKEQYLDVELKYFDIFWEKGASKAKSCDAKNGIEACLIAASDYQTKLSQQILNSIN